MSRFKLKNKVEIAKVGTWNDFEMTEAILKEAAENSDSRIPIRRGHTTIKPGEPTDGYLSNLRFDGNALLADQVLFDELAQDWKEERFINRSIDLSKRGDKYFVSAMALLGAEAPGVKGLRTFSEDNKEIIRFTDKLKKEVNMDGFKEGYEAGLKAAKDELTLEFSEKQEKVLNEKVEELTKQFNDTISEKDAKIKELEDKFTEQAEKQFNDKVEEVLNTISEDKKEEVKTELLEFKELPFEKFAKIANKYKEEQVQIPETREFSEEKGEEVSMYNSKAY